LARVIQEHIKRPLAEELLFGRLEHGGTVRVLVEGKGEESKLAFEYFPLDPAKRPKASDQDDEDDDDKPLEALVGANPRKALAGPKDKKEKGTPRGPGSSSVPNVPRPKKGE
jgi:ATP-dependent Clp protease ATP-binding subunit ClpA